MGKAVKSLAMIAVAVFAPYAAASLGLTGFAATAFSFVLQAAASLLTVALWSTKVQTLPLFL
jgi:hypothetical protein